MDIYLVAAGIYDDMTIIAALPTQEAAEQYADQWTLENLDRIYIEGDRAYVYGTVPYFD